MDPRFQASGDPMRDKDRYDVGDRLSEETIRKAEEMCERLSSSLSLDKRGEAVFVNGAVKLLDSVAEREYQVTVCDVSGQPWFTLIAETELPTSDKALLVFKSPLAEHSRYLGTLAASRPGLRAGDHGDRFFSIYEPHQDARRGLQPAR
jgi:hypothetical protein